MQSVTGNTPLQRGAFSSVEMEEAGCVKMRIATILIEKRQQLRYNRSLKLYSSETKMRCIS
jgi:hypothetical protein